MSERVILYKWPESQICLECKHSVGVVPVSMEMDERLGPTASVCMLNHIKEVGKLCLKFEQSIHSS
jgi:hypothetical protein